MLNYRIAIPQRMNFESSKIFEQAKKKAIELHDKQLYGDLPYYFHLSDVVKVLVRFGFCLNEKIDTQVLISAWLHDSLEDTNYKFEQLVNDFGIDVANLVWLVTDEMGVSRVEKKIKTYSKLKMNQYAVILKVADRIANVEACILTQNKKKYLYKSENMIFKYFLKPICSDVRSLVMWNYLDSLFLM